MAEHVPSMAVTAAAGIASPEQGGTFANNRKRLEGEAFVSHDEFSQMLEEHHQRTQKSTIIAVETITAAHNDSQTTLVRTFADATNKRLAQHDARLASVESRTDTVDAEQLQLAGKFESMVAEQAYLRDQLALANKPSVTRADLDSDAFDRPVLLGIIRVTAPKYVSSINIHNAIAPWLAHSGLSPDQWEVTGAKAGGNGRFFNVVLHFLTKA